VFFYPWEGAVLIGTTDLDHRDDLAHEPSITRGEVDYLLQAVDSQFPGVRLTAADVISCFAGVRPVVDHGSGRPPSDAAREHVVVGESGLITVSGGKLTTFRTMALQALSNAAPLVGRPFVHGEGSAGRVFAPAPALDARLTATVRRRLAARYGFDAARIAALAQDGEFDTVPGTPTLWLELRIAAQHESVRHLDDLLLRRTRIGLLRPHGALAHAEQIRALCQRALGWSDVRWDEELTRYRALIAAHYSAAAAAGTAR
jgi:glycerol-3-phosphate dehydrogenase